MPSTYAHFKFANEVLPSLPDEARKAAGANMTLYLTGCHGPDILFYYRAIKKNPVNRLGYAMHNESALPFFERAKALIAEGGEPSLAYTMGFITHFALDSTCHGYVESERKALGVTHTKLEVEFDRYLLNADGKDAVRSKLCDHICADRHCAEVIAPFFSLPAREIELSLKDMRTICNLFVCPTRVKRGIMRGILKIVGDELPDQVMLPKPDPACSESNKHMFGLFESAKDVAARLARNFTDNMNNNGLSDRFDRNYE